VTWTHDPAAPRARVTPADREDTARVEAFSDGVFAIAITLLVLDLKVPRALAPGEALATALAQQWPSYLAFVTSFATILIMWINHHRMFRLVGRVDERLLVTNGLLLLGVTVVPFPTALVAEYLGHPGERLAAAVYNGTFIVIALFFNLLWRGGARRLLRHTADPTAVAAIDHSYRFGAVYVLAFALAYVNVAASLTLNLALAAFFALPAGAHRARD
jgi:TMEM175 potassium channel family protein